MSGLSLEIKQGLAKQSLELIALEIKGLEAQLDALQEANHNATKSSAGDKYETERELLNQSRGVLENQLHRLIRLESQIRGIKIVTNERVEPGALVKLDTGIIWVSVAFGKVSYQEADYQLVSADAPLVQAIAGLGMGDSGHFRRNKVVIRELI